VNRALPALLCLLAVSCVPSKRREVDSPTWLRSGEVLIIGRVLLTPPLTPEEQSLSWLATDWRGKVMLVIGDEPTPISRPFSTSEYSGRIEAPADREFSVALPGASFSVRGCVVPLDLSGGPADQAVLPGGFRVEVKPGDVALYIGTLHYRRDEFLEGHHRRRGRRVPPHPVRVSEALGRFRPAAESADDAIPDAKAVA